MPTALKVGYPSLMGPDRLKLLERFEPESCLERNPVRGAWTKKIWRGSVKLYKQLNAETPMEPADAKIVIKQWFENVFVEGK